ncbi:MAG: DNA polymerase III subunit [Candidatus Doudnabacteria bacterium]|nr:DNA polymerase III subunit [Candidatus Doudnabacteria bacterium]
MDWKIQGHKNQIALLEKALKNGKLAHAYIFAGSDGVGKRLVAKKLAYELLDIHGDFHPDLIEVTGEGDIKIEQIRDLAYKLSLKPYQAKYKVAIIDAADTMSTQAANALLKTLEEPKDYTYIFLITSNPNRLPKTILSRSQKINFGPVDLPREQTETETQALEFYDVFINGTIADRLILAYDIADLETEDMKKVLETWIKKLESQLLQQPQKSLAQRIFQVLQARRFLEQNANSKLLLTNLMLST